MQHFVKLIILKYFLIVCLFFSKLGWYALRTFGRSNFDNILDSGYAYYTLLQTENSFGTLNAFSRTTILPHAQSKNAVCAHFDVFNILRYRPKAFCTYCVFTLSNNNVIFTCICEQTKDLYVNKSLPLSKYLSSNLNPRLTKGGCCNPPYGFSPVALKC